MKRYVYLVGLAWLLALADAQSATAIVRSWDDNGNDASKQWSVIGNWDPDGAVAANDDIVIGNLANASNDTTIYDITTQIRTLTLSSGADIDTNGNELVVNGLTTLGGTGTSLIIPINSGGRGNDSFDTDELIVNANALVSLRGGRMEIDTNQLQIEPNATISGFGFIDLDQFVVAGTQIFENSGTLTATSTSVFGDPFGINPATLQINQADLDGEIDLDGDNEIGVVNINRNDTLDINGNVTDGFSGTLNLADGATLDMSGPWELFSGDINVNTPSNVIGRPGAPARIAGGQLTMTSGKITVDTAGIDRLQISSPFVANSGTIVNANEIIFESNTTINAGVDFQMSSSSSSITVTAGHTVTINDADFNLDGSDAAGNITTIGLGAVLDINHNDVAADDTFGHTINLNGGTLDVTNAADTLPWALANTAIVDAAGGARSTIDGDAVNISATLNVTGNSALMINADSEFLSAAAVTVAAGCDLDVNVTPIYRGGSFTGAGTMRPGSATIASATTWGTNTVDLDDGSHTLNENLTVNTNSIDDSNDGFDATITIADAAKLTVNIGGGGPWTVDGPGGRITYNGDAITNTFLGGSDINLNGTLNVNGDGRTDAVLHIGNTGTVNIMTPGRPLRLSGGNLTNQRNSIAGGTINGPGILGADDLTALVGHGAINATVDFDAASDLLADNGTLNVNTIADVNSLGTADSDGVLNVIPAWNTNVAESVYLNGGTLQGGEITNGGVNGIGGHGLVTARVVNNTRIAAENNGTLIVDNANNDWDGTTNTGLLYAHNGNLELRDNAPSTFRGTVRADLGREVFINGFELKFDTASTLNLAEATYRSTNPTDFGGTMFITGKSRLQNSGMTGFGSGSNTSINGDLRLDNTETRISAGATFSGSGSLINLNGRPLTLSDGADVDVLLENRGTLTIGNSVGQTQGLDFYQSSTGTWNVELGGTGIGDYDRMTLTGESFARGTLNLSLINGYVPTAADPLITILTAGRVGNTFDVVNQPAGMPPALMFNVIYNPDSIQLDVVEMLSVQIAGRGSALGQAAAVPEPSAAVLALCEVIGFLSLRSHRVKFEGSSILPELNRGMFGRFRLPATHFFVFILARTGRCEFSGANSFKLDDYLARWSQSARKRALLSSLSTAQFLHVRTRFL